MFWPLAAIIVPLTGLLAKIEVIDGHKLPREGAYVLAPNHNSEFDPIIVADNVRRSFGGVHAVDVDHLEVPRGAITGAAGESDPDRPLGPRAAAKIFAKLQDMHDDKTLSQKDKQKILAALAFAAWVRLGQKPNTLRCKNKTWQRQGSE